MLYKYVDSLHTLLHSTNPPSLPLSSLCLLCAQGLVMEFGDGVVESMRDKTMLITGATGFLAKVFVEKVLRAQPDVKKLYILIRAGDDKVAAKRLQTEIAGKELFRVLRQKYGNLYQAFISEKLCPVVGDVSFPELGIKDFYLLEKLQNEVNVVLNVAANTNFEERYEVALAINTLGAKHVLNFAEKCTKIDMLLHVSTAFVAGEKEGLLMERKFVMGETLNGELKVDIDEEVRLAEETIKKLHFNGSSEKEVKTAMKELGMRRAKHFGWPNTYVFTKAMGEMILGHMKGELPLVIIRPAIITSLLKEPIPGWMEGSRTIDSLIIGYARGKLNCFLGDRDLIMDVIPGDWVVNAMIVAMVAHSNHPGEHIYHVGSSVSNPVKYATLIDVGYDYFCKHPRITKDGRVVKTIKLPMYSTMESFKVYMMLRYKLPLQGLGLVNAALCGLLSERYTQLQRKYNYVMHLVDLYKPYVFFKGCFDDLNLERLRISWAETANTEELKMFWFDPKLIDWDRYFHDVHIPGVLKYVCK